MPTYTPEQYINKVNKDIQSLFDAKKELAGAVYESIRLMDHRIFDQGKDGSGGEIGTYSQKPIYVNPNNPNNPKKFPTGRFKNGRPRKTGKFGSYAIYKSAIGRGSGGRVNLQLNKFFRRSFLTRNIPVRIEGSTVVIQFGMGATKANSLGKINGLVKRYPKAFMPSKREQAIVFDDFRDILLKHLNR